MRIDTRASILAAATAAVLTACSAPSTTPPIGGDVSAPFVRQTRTAACKGQTTTSEYASASGTLGSRPGALCIPSFDGFSGHFEYPAAKPSVTVTTISSTKNYNATLPSLHHGKPAFYLQVATSGPTDFGKRVRPGGGLSGKHLVPGRTYTVYGQAKLGGVAGITMTLTPCAASASKGKNAGTIQGLGTLLEGQNIGGSANVVFEVYAGKHAKACQ